MISLGKSPEKDVQDLSGWRGGRGMRRSNELGTGKVDPGQTQEKALLAF